MSEDTEESARYPVENNSNQPVVSIHLEAIRQRERARAEVKALKEEVKALKEKEQDLMLKLDTAAGTMSRYRQWVERLIVENNDMAEALARAGRKYTPLANPNRITLRK